jgi:hypothetical protein
LGLVLVAVVVTGCASAGSGSGGSSSATSRSTSSQGQTLTTTSTTADPSSSAATQQQQAVAAYQAMWAAWVTAALTSDPTSKSLGRHAAGNALELIVTSLSQDKREGMVTRGQPVLKPRVQAATPSSAPTHVTIADCADATHWLKYRASTGTLKDDVPGGRHTVNAVVQNVNGTWLVVQFLVQPVGTC